MSTIAQRAAAAREDRLATLTGVFDRIIPRDGLERLAAAGLTALEVGDWVSGTDPALYHYHAGRIPDLLDAGITRDLCRGYHRVNVTDPAHMLALHQQGCPPAVAVGYARHGCGPALFSGNWFVMEYRRARRHAPVAVCNAVLASGGDADTVAAWGATGLPAETVTLARLAGIAPTEAAADPDVLADPDRLRTLAALRGHQITLPITVPMVPTATAGEGA